MTRLRRAACWAHTAFSSSLIAAHRFEIIWTSSGGGRSGYLALSSLRTSFWKRMYEDGGRLGAFGSLIFLVVLRFFFLPSPSSSSSSDAADLRLRPLDDASWAKRAKLSAMSAHSRSVAATWANFWSSWRGG